MRQAIIYTTDKDYPFFLKMVKSLSIVKKIETDEDLSKKEILDGIKKGLNEVKLIQEGKIKAQTLNDFLDEL